MDQSNQSPETERVISVDHTQDLSKAVHSSASSLSAVNKIVNTKLKVERKKRKFFYCFLFIAS